MKSTSQSYTYFAVEVLSLTINYGTNPTFMNIIGKSRPEILPEGCLHVLDVHSDSVCSGILFQAQP